VKTALGKERHLEPVGHPVRNDRVDEVVEQVGGAALLAVAAERVDDQPEVVER
jgi:hypothetical protein